MKVFISSILLLLSDVSWVCCVETRKGSVGESVEFNCQYPEEYQPLSVYLKKMSDIDAVIELKESQTTYTKGRYSLYHESGVIIATIHNLSTKDTGTYRCVPASLYGNNEEEYLYTEFRLEVEAPPTSKLPLTTGSTSAHISPTGNTSAHSSPTGDILSSRNTSASELESTSTHGNLNTTLSQADTNAFLYGGLIAAVLVGLLVLTFILMRTRMKRTETPRSSQRNPSNAEEINVIYAKIEDTDNSADKLQSPATAGNHQDSSPIVNIYTTANQNPEQQPASSQSANQIFETNTEPEDSNLIYSVITNSMQPKDMPAANQNSVTDDTYTLATNPIPPTGIPAANQNSETDDTYALATNPIPPTGIPAANQNSEIDDTYALATNSIPPTDMPAANQNSEVDDTYALATNPIAPTYMAASSSQSEF